MLVQNPFDSVVEQTNSRPPSLFAFPNGVKWSSHNARTVSHDRQPIQLEKPNLNAIISVSFDLSLGYQFNSNLIGFNFKISILAKCSLCTLTRLTGAWSSYANNAHDWPIIGSTICLSRTNRTFATPVFELVLLTTILIFFIIRIFLILRIFFIILIISFHFWSSWCAATLCHPFSFAAPAKQILA